MKIVGCDLHTRYQQIAMLDDETGEFGRASPGTRQRRSKGVLLKADRSSAGGAGGVPHSSLVLA